MYIVYVYVLCMVNGKGIILIHICSIKYINDGEKVMIRDTEFAQLYGRLRPAVSSVNIKSKQIIY